jgi:hypothetical protein
MESRPGSSIWDRAFGAWAARSGASGEADRFHELAARADQVGVRWRDLLGDGYSAPADLVAGGIRVRFDWTWRANELQRRLDQAAEDGTDHTA